MGRADLSRRGLSHAVRQCAAWFSFFKRCDVTATEEKDKEKEKPKEPYVFPGVREFLVDEGLEPSLAGRILGVHFLVRAMDSLAQISTAPPHAHKEMYEYIEMHRKGLENTLATFDRAVAAVKKHYPAPKDKDKDKDKDEDKGANWSRQEAKKEPHR